MLPVIGLSSAAGGRHNIACITVRVSVGPLSCILIIYIITINLKSKAATTAFLSPVFRLRNTAQGVDVVQNFRMIAEILVGNLLGEGVQWRPGDRSLWWTDILDNKMYRLEWRQRSVRRIDVPEPLGSFAFTAKPNTVAAAFATGFALFDYESGALDWIHRPDFLEGEGRFNDGRADRQGRFWSGTMMASPSHKSPAAGRLFCLDAIGAVSEHEHNIGISNGLCWSPDGGTLYFADSLPGIIYAYDFDGTTGTPRNRRVFAKSPAGGSPDGAAVDAAGNVWSAQWGIGKVLAYNPAGEIIAEVPVPASQPTCVAFGGEDLDLLFVTSAKDGLDKDTLEGEPSAGNVFVFETGTKGLPETIYRGAA